jgi:hypothetical protein
VFPIGDTNVVCAATDSGGLTYRASFNVHLASSPVQPPPSPTEDTLPPFSPTVTVPSPDYVDQDGAWYRAPITVQVQDNGDRQSTDGSPVSGVDPSSYQTQVTITDSGPHTISGLTVKDLAGNESNAAPGITLQLDAGAPAVDLTCPDVPVVEGTDLTASWTASDSGSGLSTPAAGTLQLDTNEEGHYVATLPAGSAVDNVGNDSAETSCSYVVLEAPKPDPSPTTPPEANPGPDSSATGATLPPGNTQPDPGDGAASQGAATDNALTGQLDPGDGPAAMGLIRQVGPPAASGVEP